MAAVAAGAIVRNNPALFPPNFDRFEASMSLLDFDVSSEATSLEGVAMVAGLECAQAMTTSPSDSLAEYFQGT